jgi:hypothetical protein
MSTPFEEEGYEIATGDYAQENWWPKDYKVHQCWEDGGWCRVGEGQNFFSSWIYRRPVVIDPQSIIKSHFI